MFPLPDHFLVFLLRAAFPNTLSLGKLALLAAAAAAIERKKASSMELQQRLYSHEVLIIRDISMRAFKESGWICSSLSSSSSLARLFVPSDIITVPSGKGSLFEEEDGVPQMTPCH